MRIPFGTGPVSRFGCALLRAALIPLVMCVMEAAAAVATEGSTRPVFQVDFPHPTVDKPQSKLWYAQDCWWALLPTSSGPSLWQRTADGWHEQGAVRRALAGLPARCDVWFDRDGVTAVGIAGKTLAVYRIVATNDSSDPWRAEKLAIWEAKTAEPLETATIARDQRGEWWIAVPTTPPGKDPVASRTNQKNKPPRAVHVWHSNDGRTWTALAPLADGIGGDDICMIAALEGGVGVAWSDQNRDEVAFRLHRDGSPPDRWEPAEIIASGSKTADDHLHAAVADGKLWLATKNSVDTVGQPQLVLRVRSAAGTWQNLPYQPKTADWTPSRPIVVATPDGQRLVLAQTDYAGKGKIDRISSGSIGVRDAEIAPMMAPVIEPDPADHVRVNDVTGPKAAFPSSAPWILLASDEKGAIYEADVTDEKRLRFTVTSDPHQRPENYDHVLAAMKRHSGGQGAFQIVVGDLCQSPRQTPQVLRDRVDAHFGKDARWIPVVGNHDAEVANTSESMSWLRTEFSTGHDGRLSLRAQGVKPGPPGSEDTTYSWDEGNAHFVVLNLYWNGETDPGSDVVGDGDVVPALLAWLERDLAANTKPFVFVFGHEPAFPRFRHVGDSLDQHPENRDAFWALLVRHKVQVYFCGHVHSYFKEQRDGVWQVCDGHAGRNRGGDRVYLDVIVGGTAAEVRVWKSVDENWAVWEQCDTIRFDAAQNVGAAGKTGSNPGNK